MKATLGGESARLEKWLETISEQRRSGQTQREFCAKRGISLATFGYWVKRTRSSRSAKPSEGALIEVPMPRLNAGAAVVLEIGSVVKLRIAREGSAGWVAQLLRELRCGV